MSEIVFTAFTHEAMLAGIHAIAQASEAWAPTLLVGVGRGGLTPAVFLSHRMNLPMVSIDYSSGLAPFGEALIPVLAERASGGERLLFVEDINDTGKTIAALRDALASHGAPADKIRFAVLIDNHRSAARVDYRYREIDRAVTKDWFVFPWEAMAAPQTVAAEAEAVPERLA